MAFRGELFSNTTAILTVCLELLNKTRSQLFSLCNYTSTTTVLTDMNIFRVIRSTSSTVRANCHFVICYLNQIWTMNNPYRKLSANVYIFKRNSDFDSSTRTNLFLLLSLSINTCVRFLEIPYPPPKKSPNISPKGFIPPCYSGWFRHSSPHWSYFLLLSGSESAS